jgi:hypothetical protein
MRGISFDERDTRVELEGLETFLKVLKMRAPMARIGILGPKNVRREQKKASRGFGSSSKFQSRFKASKTETAAKISKGIYGAGNAVIGAAHEFGSMARSLPKRSFLREPLIEHLQKKLNAAGAFSEAEQKEILEVKSLVPWTKKVGVLAEEVVRGAFDSNGYGKWAPLKPATLQGKTTADTLVETTQLRDSIISDVKASQ